MAIVKWNNNSGNWTGNPTDWSTGSAPGTTDIAEIQTGSNDLTTTVTVASVVIDSGATLTAGSGAVLTTTNGINNAGTFVTSSQSTVNIGGLLTNSGSAAIGSSSLAAATTVTAAGLMNTGTVNLQGNAASGTSNQATLDITAAAPTDATGTMNVSGDADLEFASGGITAIALGAQLELDGALARVSIGSGTTSTALSGLASNAGTFLLRGSDSNGAGGASLTTTTSFSNAGTLGVDAASGDGGSGLTVGGTLTNTGTATIGNTALGASTTVAATNLVNSGTLILLGNAAGGTADQATLDITGAAPATATGTIIIDGDADLEFVSGGITAIGSGALLELDGAAARVTIGASTSALSKLATNSGTFLLRGDNANGAGGGSMTTKKSFTNNGSLQVDSFGGDGGSSLTIGGKLTNAATTVIGNTLLSASTTVTATSLVNDGTLTLQGHNGVNPGEQATLDITTAAPSSATGDIIVSGDADLEFASGGITAVGTGAELELDGALARISIGSTTTSSALSKLATNNGTFLLRGNNSGGSRGTSVTTTVSFTNSGTLQLDSVPGDEGSSLTIGRTLINAGAAVIGNANAFGGTTVTADGLRNTGSLTVQGTVIMMGQTTSLDITGAAPSTLTGFVRIGGEADLKFASGGIRTIGAGAKLELDGVQALISIGSTNSALSKLATNDGTLLLRGDSSLGAQGALLTTTTSGLTLTLASRV
jgi:hypothetical protein